MIVLLALFGYLLGSIPFALLLGGGELRQNGSGNLGAANVLRSRRTSVTFSPALYVFSTTFPRRTFLSLVLTNAPPLPGLTCWK